MGMLQECMFHGHGACNVRHAMSHLCALAHVLKHLEGSTQLHLKAICNTYRLYLCTHQHKLGVAIVNLNVKVKHGIYNEPSGMLHEPQLVAMFGTVCSNYHDDSTSICCLPV